MTPVTIGELAPNEMNPRRISDEKLAMLRDSLKEFGDLSGFVYNRKTKRLVGGHQRQKAIPTDAKITIETQFAKPTPNGTVAEGFVLVGGERFRYREVNWPPKKERLAMLAANQHGGEWETDQLANLLSEMDVAGRLLAGFDEEETNRLLASITAPADFPVVDENLPIEHKCPKCGYKWSGKPA